jgi:hypothetical protein
MTMDMDEVGEGRWQSKLKQHRENRRLLYNKQQHPNAVYEAVTAYNGAVLHDWMAIFEGYWNRLRPENPAREAEMAKKAIAEHIAAEKAAILKELAGLWGDAYKDDIPKGEKKLEQSCETLTHKCFEHVANLRAARERELKKETADKRRRLIDLAVTMMISLLAGGLIAWFSVWLTNKGNRANLEPRLELSIGQIDRLGMITISSDTLNLTIQNIGPNTVNDVEIFVQAFHASFNLGEIVQHDYSSKPTFGILSLDPGQEVSFRFGNDDRFGWKNVFETEENVYRKDPRYKKLLLFCRIHARYRREQDKKIFHTTRIFHATRQFLIPWDITFDRDDFLAGYDR